MKKICLLSVGFIFLLSVAAVPISAFQLGKGSGGTLGCGGNHHRRLSGTELTFTSYTFRNFNMNRTLIIDDIRIFAADGTTLASFPPFPAGFDNVLAPHQTANFTTIDVFGTADLASIPIQLVANWRTADGQNGLQLWGTFGRQDRERDPSTNALLEQKTRGPVWCATLKLSLNR
jgi:hypothetical protein